LRHRKIFESCIIEFDADAAGIDIRIMAPFAEARLPGTEIIIEHVVNRTILAYHIVRAHFGMFNSKSMQCHGAAILRRMMNNNKIRFPHIEIHRTHPFACLRGEIVGWLFPEPVREIFYLLLINLIACPVRIGAAAEQEGDQKNGEFVEH